MDFQFVIEIGYAQSHQRINRLNMGRLTAVASAKTLDDEMVLPIRPRRSADSKGCNRVEYVRPYRLELFQQIKQALKESGSPVESTW